jgi:hypothetical protein
MPGRGVVAVTVSNAMENVCRLGVVLRKSGLNESRLTNQSLAPACVMSEPDKDTRLKSSPESPGCALTHRLNASTIFVKRWMALPSRTARLGPGLIATTSWMGTSNLLRVSIGRDTPSS